MRVLSSPEDKGKSFGWFEGARGVASAIMTPLAVIAFRFGMNADGKHDIAGMRQVIVFYSVITVFSGLLVLWKMRDDGSKSTKANRSRSRHRHRTADAGHLDHRPGHVLQLRVHAVRLLPSHPTARRCWACP